MIQNSRFQITLDTAAKVKIVLPKLMVNVKERAECQQTVTSDVITHSIFLYGCDICADALKR